MTELSLEAVPVGTLALSSAVAPQSFERDVAVACFTEQLLKEDDPRGILAQPIECIAQTAQGAAQGVER